MLQCLFEKIAGLREAALQADIADGDFDRSVALLEEAESLAIEHLGLMHLNAYNIRAQLLPKYILTGRSFMTFFYVCE